MATNYKQAVYSDFSGGYNDTSSAISIGDNEFAMSENADYAAELHALHTRKGCTKLHPVLFNANATDAYSWRIGSQDKVAVVIDSKLYEWHVESKVFLHKIDLSPGAEKIYPFVVYNTLYFTDGAWLYSWGAFDYSTEGGGIVDLKYGDVVRCTNNEQGSKGAFYKSVQNRQGVDLSTEDFKGEHAWMNWEECTDVLNFSSANVRIEYSGYDPSAKERISIKILTSALSAGSITLALNNPDGSSQSFFFTVAQGATPSSIITDLKSMISGNENWDIVRASGNLIVLECKNAGAVEQGYLDPGNTGIQFLFETKVQGKNNDCNIADISKCTIFCVHTYSFRVFAAGNPDDHAVYYSEIGNPLYWKADINKVYPAVNGFGKVTGMIDLSDYLLVSYENGWYAWTGISPLEDANWKPLNIPYGCIAPRSLVMTPNSFTFLSKEGIITVSAAVLNDTYVILENQNVIRNISDNKVEKTIKYFTGCDPGLIDGIFYENAYYLSTTSDGTKDGLVLKYDWSSAAFTLITGWIVNRWFVSSDGLCFASIHYLLKAFDGYSDVDVDTGEDKPISLHVKTKEYHFGTPFSNKNAQLIGFIFQQHDRIDSSLKIIIHAGYKKYTVRAADLADSLYYGRMWGAAWGYREAIVKVVETIIPGNTFQIEFINNNLDDPVTLIGIGFIYENTDYVLPTILKDEVLLQ